MKLLITIDTEEDGWGSYPHVGSTLESIKKIPELQKLFDSYDARPTYLITYPVVKDPTSVEILKRVHGEGNCEIGMHCHPWNTPPFSENQNTRIEDTMLCNLPEKLHAEKLANLHDEICNAFGTVPVSFRAGRWGFSGTVARSLVNLDYRVDTSVTPYFSWEDHHGPNFAKFDPEVFRCKPEGLTGQYRNRSLLEVPVSIGFLQGNFPAMSKLRRVFETKVIRNFHIIGILSRMRLMNRVWLSPEITDACSMIKLAERFDQYGYPCINMSFHSNSLVSGSGFLVQTMADERRFFSNTRKFLDHARKKGYEAQTLSEFEEEHVVVEDDIVSCQAKESWLMFES